MYSLFPSNLIIATVAVKLCQTLPSLCTQTHETQARKRTFDDELINFNYTLQSKNDHWQAIEETLLGERNHDSNNPDQKKKKRKTE